MASPPPLSQGVPRPSRFPPAVGPALRRLLWGLLGGLAILAANSLYLSSVTLLEWATGRTYQNYFYLCMVLVHLGLGLLLVVPTTVFVAAHLVAARQRPNRRARQVGYALLVALVALLVSGLLLMRLGPLELKSSGGRQVVYWLHLGAPLAALWMYWLHRLAGPPIAWRLGLGYLAGVAALVLAALSLHSLDPRRWNTVGPAEGEQYFRPSLARTSSGEFIPSQTLMMDHYCQECHQDAYQGWFHSAHRFSSFNNPMYLASVRETRAVMLERNGNVQGSRFCAGCHDPVPFFSGAFDDPKFDDIHHPTAQAGITCTVCHAITHVNSSRGNADFTIEEPLHYPWAGHEQPFLAALNRQLVKAKPAFHKKTFLKPLHRTAEFCGACHKVHLPGELTDYKPWLRGQNHYDSYLLSGVSGHGARSFYYPPAAQTNCNGCHMPAVASADFGARLLPGTDRPSIHQHLFLGANTALPYLRGEPPTVAVHQKFLEGTVRVDLFGLRGGEAIDGPLTAPLRPQLPELKPGESYVLEVVLRTLKLGHHFTQGTADSNEVWLEIEVRDGDRLLAQSGARDSSGAVDPWSHFVNAFVLDRHGRRIDRRNAQDIFVPLYDHQIPPGAGQVVHYALRVPPDARGPITIDARLNFRKFDQFYLKYVLDQVTRPDDRPVRDNGSRDPANDLPITVIASDRVVLPVQGGSQSVPDSAPAAEPLWQRWNDFGIGLLLDGQTVGGQGDLRQSADAFAMVESLGRADGPLNLARVYLADGRLDDAAEALARAVQAEPPAPPWTVAWLSGMIHKQRGDLEEAEQNFLRALEYQDDDTRRRGFDFSRDYVVRNELGQARFERAKAARRQQDSAAVERWLRLAVESFEQTLAEDSENLTAHFNLALIFQQLGEEKRAERHRALHETYRIDDNAREQAVTRARLANRAADHASQRVVIYPLLAPGESPGPAQVAPRIEPPAAAPPAAGH